MKKILLPDFQEIDPKGRYTEADQQLFLYLGTEEDVFLSSHSIDISFLKYLKETVGYPLPIISHPKRLTGTLSASVLADKENMDFLRKQASTGPARLLPAGIGPSTMTLCQILNNISPEPIFLEAAPLVLLSWLDHKHMFKDVVGRILGENKTPRWEVSYSLSGLVKSILRMQPESRKIMLKLPGGFSGAGNCRVLVYDHPKFYRTFLQINKFLEKKVVSRCDEVLLSEEFIDHAIAAPTVQFYISGQGAVRFLVACDQIINARWSCTGADFPTSLPPDLVESIVGDCRKIAEYIASYGYLGNCNFDLLVTEDRQVYFLECNARFGKTSYPFFLMRHLFPGEGLFYCAREYECCSDRLPIFERILDKINPEILYHCKGRREGTLIYHYRRKGPILKIYVIGFATQRQVARGYCEAFGRCVA